MRTVIVADLRELMRRGNLNLGHTFRKESIVTPPNADPFRKKACHPVMPLLPTLQATLFWKRGEERTLLTVARSHSEAFLHTVIDESALTTFTVKCTGKAHGPYGVAVLKFLKMRNQLLFGGPPPSIPPTNVECQYAARIDDSKTDRENFLGLICYERFDEGRSDVERPLVMPKCDEDIYPGSDFPRIRLPEHLKSVYASVMAYAPTQFELYVDSRWPRNSHERTGFAGQGHLKNSGANPVLYLVVTSHPTNNSQIILEDLGDSTNLPQCVPRLGGTVDSNFIEDCIVELSREMGGCPRGELNALLKGGYKKLHEGYLKDPLNTDNAWMEGLIIHIHDALGSCFGSSTQPLGKRSKPYFWESLTSVDKGISDYVSAFIANYK
ncbi:hypothetical protein M513_06145 [Trichuris suis]|uniref:Uncharacterized protein n=1 Tax=Trichuris suis TaxID=68888 RepID=A0A085M733_9BILA|nr:hypothetical protein M513_06145 [Trichuris suis]